MAESTMIVLVFDEEQRAEQLWQRLEELQRSGLVPRNDAAMVICRQDGQVIVQQVVHAASEGDFNVQTWEFIIKTLLSGWSLGIDDWFIQQIKQQLLPGTSAFFILVDEFRSQEALLAFRSYQGKLFYNGLTAEDKAKIKRAAGQA